MKKLKTLFSITLVIDILAVAPLFLMMFIPTMKEEMVYSQFPGMMENELAKEISDLFHFVCHGDCSSCFNKNISLGSSQNSSIAIIDHSLGLGSSRLA